MEHRVLSELRFETHWNRLCTVRCLHNYYPDKICGDLAFAPTPETEQLMRNLRILFRAEKDGFVLLYEKDKETDFVRRAFAASEKLSFKVSTQGSSIYAFSKLPWHPDLKVFHLHNAYGQKSKSGDILLHKGTYLHEDQDARPAQKPMQFTYAADRPIAGKDVKVLSFDGSEVRVPSLAEDAVRQQHAIDLRHCPGGAYTIKAKGHDDHYVYCVKQWDELAFGYVDFFLNGSHKSGHLVESKGVTPQSFAIHLDARSTYWKYILIGRPQRNGSFTPTDIEVTEQGKTIKFSKPQQISLQNGDTAFSIETKDEIPFALVKNHVDRLEMKVKSGNKWMNKKVALPKPDVQMIKPDAGSNKLYAVTYVYI